MGNIFFGHKKYFLDTQPHLGIAVQDVLAAILSLEGQLALGGFAADEDVPLGDILTEADPATSPSRLPLRG